METATEWVDQPTGGGPGSSGAHPILLTRDYDATALDADESILTIIQWVKVQNAGGVWIVASQQLRP